MKISPLWLVVILALLAMATISREDFFPNLKPHEISKEDEKVITENWSKITSSNLVLFQLFFRTKEEQTHNILYEVNPQDSVNSSITLISDRKDARVARKLIRILNQVGIRAEKVEIRNINNTCQMIINLPQRVFSWQLGDFLKEMGRFFYKLELKNCLFVPELKNPGLILFLTRHFPDHFYLLINNWRLRKSPIKSDKMR